MKALKLGVFALAIGFFAASCTGTTTTDEAATQDQLETTTPDETMEPTETTAPDTAAPMVDTTATPVE